MDKLDQQYVQVKQQWLTTKQRLQVINREIGVDSGKFDAMRQQIGRIAVTAYEDGNLNSSMALLTSSNPQQILNQSSILLELSDSNNAQIAQFLAATRQLTSHQLLARRTNAGLAQLKAGLLKRRAKLNTLVSNQQALLNQLTPAQQVGVAAGGGQTGVKYNGPTSTQAQKAVAFAYGRLGCPYVFGGTGPCAAGYDCSGLTMSAWAAAGVSIPRTSEEQWAQLPHVSASKMEPGDIMVFNGAGHVGIFVGNNKLIDAPVPGQNVQLVAFSGWYQSTFDGAVRP